MKPMPAKCWLEPIFTPAHWAICNRIRHMKSLIAVLMTSAALVGAAQAEGITEFNIGVLGGENAQDRMTSNECLRAYAEETLGVPVKLFTPADYDCVIQGLLGGTLDMALLGA